MDARVKQLLDTMTARANEARQTVKTAAGEAWDKVDEVKANLEISRLRSEQEKVFADIGRLVYYMSTSAEELPTEGKTPRQALDDLLIDAEQFEQEIGNIARRAGRETP